MTATNLVPCPSSRGSPASIRSSAGRVFYVGRHARAASVAPCIAARQTRKKPGSKGSKASPFARARRIWAREFVDRVKKPEMRTEAHEWPENCREADDVGESSSFDAETKNERFTGGWRRPASIGWGTGKSGVRTRCRGRRNKGKRFRISPASMTCFAA